MTDLSVLRETEVAPFDFRRPNLLSREDVRGIEVTHEVFTRRLATRWSSRLRALVQADPVGFDQARYDDYVRSMPTPTVLGTIALPPLPGAAIVEMNSQLALRLVDRMLGGAGTGLGGGQDLARRPTDLEDALVRDLVTQAAAALQEALDPQVEGAQTLSVDYNAHQVQVAAPSDMVAVLTYQVSVTQGVECEGLLSICYPGTMLRPIIEHVQEHTLGGSKGEVDQSAARRVLAERLDDIPVDVSVCLEDTEVSAGELARLAVGDVLRLDHHLGRPVVARVGEHEVLEGHVGRRGRRVALQVSGWRQPEWSALPPALPPGGPDEEPLTDRSNG
jgi:flagellar motor switch protein FliM